MATRPRAAWPEVGPATPCPDRGKAAAGIARALVPVIVVVPIVGPALVQMDMYPVRLGVLIAVNLQTSLMAPPLGPTLFYIEGVPPSGAASQEVHRGAIPFVVVKVSAFCVLAASRPRNLAAAGAVLGAGPAQGHSALGIGSMAA